MVSDNDTDEHQSGSPREKTDPSFPGPMRSPAHEERVSDTLPAAAAVAANPAAAPRTPSPAAPVTSGRSASDPPASRTKAHTESIDELIDGLAGDGVLPRKHKPASDSKIVAAARKPAPPAPPEAPLPTVLVRPDSNPDLEHDGERRSDPTVLTPVAIARRSRGKTWLAGFMGIILAVLVLAFIRRATRGDEDEVVTPATAQGAVATTTSALAPVPSLPTMTTMSATPTVSPPVVPDDVRPVASGATVAPRVAASAARSAQPTPRSSSELEEFRKTIRQ